MGTFFLGQAACLGTLFLVGILKCSRKASNVGLAVLAGILVVFSEGLGTSGWQCWLGFWRCFRRASNIGLAVLAGITEEAASSIDTPETNKAQRNAEANHIDCL